MSTDTAPLNALETKQKITGKVVKITRAGAVVDIGMDVPGVIHISQLSATPVNKVEDVIQVDQTIEAWVRRVKENRVELTMTEPLGLEWREMKPEMVVKGTVVRLETYGAFVEIGAERPGLIHVSELAHGFVRTPADVVKENDEVEVMILEVNRRKKQIRLSMKAIAPKEEAVTVEAPRSKPERKSKSKRTKAKDFSAESTAPGEIEPTAFEIAWQKALEKQQEKKFDKDKKVKSGKQEQEDLLNRTLEQRLPTGS